MMKIMKNRASKFGRFKYKKYQKPNPSRGKYNNTENRGFFYQYQWFELVHFFTQPLRSPNKVHLHLYHLNHYLGAFNNQLDIIILFFDHPPTSVDTFMH